MNQTSLIISGVIVAAIVLVLLAVAIGFGTTTTTVSVGGPSVADPIDPPADGSHGVVFSKYETSPGWSLFGWRIREPGYRASVALVLPPGCEVEPGERLVREGSCAGAVAEGDHSGGGTAPGGVEFVIVAVSVNGECYEALDEGDRWPSPHPACA